MPRRVEAHRSIPCRSAAALHDGQTRTRWAKSRMADGLAAQDRVLTAVRRELVAAGIDLPFPTRQILFHDQTEETDGDRRRQREGWPVGDGQAPAARGIAAAMLSARASANGSDPHSGDRGR